MTLTATGTFQIRMTPHAPQEASSPHIGRMHFEKDWEGDLRGHSQGEMLSVGSPGSGAASYVALEFFTGTLNGRAGQFAFRQVGDMHAGNVQLTYEVVPRSGGGALTGLGGTLTLDTTGGHHYALRYDPTPGLDSAE